MRPKRYYLDTNVVISLVEAPAALSAAQTEIVSGIESGTILVATSELTLAECLVKPLKDGDKRKVDAYMDFLSGAAHLPIVPVDRGVLILAARLRAELLMKLPDAIHVATASYIACDTFVSVDLRLKLPDDLKSLGWA